MLLVWLLAAIGMSVPVVGKTLVFSLNDTGLELQKLTDNLLATEGVLDVMIDLPTNLIYVKTNSVTFNAGSFNQVMAGQG